MNESCHRYDMSDKLWRLLIDASFVKAHKDAYGAVGGSQDVGRSKGGQHLKSILLWTRLVVQLESLSARVQSMIAQKLMS